MSSFLVFLPSNNKELDGDDTDPYIWTHLARPTPLYWAPISFSSYL